MAIFTSMKNLYSDTNCKSDRYIVIDERFDNFMGMLQIYDRVWQKVIKWERYSKQFNLLKVDLYKVIGKLCDELNRENND